MDREQAVQVIANVCASFQGNLAQHGQIQQARRALGLLTPEELAAVEPALEATPDPSSNGQGELTDATAEA